MQRTYPVLDKVGTYAGVEESIHRVEWLSASAYAIVLLWTNFYVCRGLLSTEVPTMASMHGFWSAIARLAGSGWFHAEWWPYSDAGIPFEFTYTPLVPWLTAIGAAGFHVSHLRAFQFVSAAAYCLSPVTLFLMAWLITRAPGYSFLAGLFYSLTTPSTMQRHLYRSLPRRSPVLSGLSMWLLPPFACCSS